jgi:hypothetical protein
MTTLMRPATGIAIALGLGLGLAACNDNSSDRTLTSTAKREISQNTSETSDPIMVNDLSLSGHDSKDTASPSGV